MDNLQTIVFGYIVKTTKLPRLRRQTIKVTHAVHGAYIAEQWAVFPTIHCMLRYIAELENLHMELDGKRAITREDVKQKIQQTERSGKIEEEFTLLMRKGYKLPGFSEPSIRLPLPVDPEIVWSFETGRFKRVVDSWASSTDKSDSMIKEARDQLEAAAWLDILANTEEYRDWEAKTTLRPQLIQRFRPLPQPSSSE